MNDKQKQQYKIRYEIENYLCYKSGKRAMNMAHRIANTKVNRKLYGNRIDHNFNLCPASSLEENDLFNIGNNPGKVRRLIELIDTRGNERLTAEYISNYIEDKQ